MISTEFLITSLIVVLLPGTGVIYTISIGLFQNARASTFAALGCTAGIIPSLLACILGLAAVIHTSALLFQIIKFVGVAYLLYLAWGMWKETGGLVLEDNGDRASMLAVGTKGFLINILNPKLSVFFLAFLPQFVPAQAASPLINMLVLGVVFMAMTLFVFIFYGLLANSVSTYVVSSPKIMKYVQRTFSATFAMLGAKLAFAEL
ncbi:lysine transporter LysE [Shewanella hanedai]|uniref:LysE family translocator n=1 Tax=Shewanella hanedai TaxID=25 RepID=A0A553JJJ6_SHEHA|nr:LysE family translocator [Shewanella hanedai]TRY12633.1 LysE family translocator [Shewanella hanedai]GGI94634.1 lysine transporter LysE [Shewanella hanedai]